MIKLPARLGSLLIVALAALFNYPASLSADCEGCAINQYDCFGCLLGCGVDGSPCAENCSTPTCNSCNLSGDFCQVLLSVGSDGTAVLFAFDGKMESVGIPIASGDDRDMYRRGCDAIVTGRAYAAEYIDGALETVRRIEV